MMTNAELREIDARIEREIFGRCAHINHTRCHCAYNKAARQADYECTDCGYHFNAPAHPAYHTNWNACMGLLLPEMDRRGWCLLYSSGLDISTLDNPKPKITVIVEFQKSGFEWPTVEHEDGRISICLAALRAVEGEK